MIANLVASDTCSYNMLGMLFVNTHQSYSINFAENIDKAEHLALFINTTCSS